MKLYNEFQKFSRSNGVPSLTLDGYAKAMNNTATYINPTITEERKMNVAQMDVFSRLMMDRILFLGTGIDSDVANIVNSQLLFLQMSDPEKPVTLYINSGGGSVTDGMAIYDTAKLVTCPVYTTCCGLAASMAAVLLASGDKGHRNSLKHSKIMLHQPSGGSERVTAADFAIVAKQMEDCKIMLYEALAEDTGKPFEHIAEICDRDFWMTPEEAIAEGVIDSILTR